MTTKPAHVRVCADVREASTLFLAALESARADGSLIRARHARFLIETADQTVEWVPARTVAIHLRGRVIRSWDVVAHDPPVALTDEALETLRIAELTGNVDLPADATP